MFLLEDSPVDKEGHLANTLLGKGYRDVLQFSFGCYTNPNYDVVLRVAYSIRTGVVPGALIMGKLGSYARQNSVATALREMGWIEKMIFLVEYLSQKTLRRRIHTGLNKGESMNALARAIFFGKHGEFRERALHDQLQRASALNILINAISVWNTVYLTEALKVLKAQGTLDESLLTYFPARMGTH